MNFVITEEFITEYPTAKIGVIVANQLDNATSNDKLTELLRFEESKIRTELAGITVSQHPHVAPWREAYRQFGAKPKKYPSSIENLMKRVLKGEELRPINPLVDLYNVVSLRHLLPAGGEDLDRMSGDLRLTIAGDSEPAIQLLGDREARAPYPREVIYTDDIGAVCRRWNWKEADRTKLTAETKNAILVVEIIPPIPAETLTAALSDLDQLIHKYCGGQVTTNQAIIDADNSVLAL